MLSARIRRLARRTGNGNRIVLLLCVRMCFSLSPSILLFEQRTRNGCKRVAVPPHALSFHLIPPRPERPSSPTRRSCPPYRSVRPGNRHDYREVDAIITLARKHSFARARARYYTCAWCACVCRYYPDGGGGGGAGGGRTNFDGCFFFAPFLLFHFIIIVPGRKRGKKQINTRARAATTLRTTRRHRYHDNKMKKNF